VYRSKNGKLAANISNRVAKGVASLSIIRAILQDIPLGKHRIEIGLDLRKALFIISVLCNSEIRHSFKESDITELKLIDNQILRFICSAQAKTPVEFLFLETGSLSLSHIISQRRIIYLNEIITREDNELVKRIYRAQKDNPTRGDFVELVTEDLKTIKEDFDEDIFLKYSKIEFKNHIKKKIKTEALNQFKLAQEGHSKVREINYTKLEPQAYLKSALFSNKECELLIALRSNSVRGIKATTPSIFKNNMTCPLKCSTTRNEDDQQHLLDCSSIKKELAIREVEESKKICISDIYKSVEIQKAAVTTFRRILEVRAVLLEESCSAPTPTSGSTLATASRACQGGDGD
jgi:hypothetical protein